MTAPLQVSTSTHNIAIAYDYSTYYERMATALETIATKLTSIEQLSTSTGVRVVGPYDWTQGVESYNWYILQNHGFTTSTVTLNQLNTLIQNMKSVAGQFPTYE